MKALNVSIGTVTVTIRSNRAHAKGQKSVNYWSSLYQLGATAKDATLAGLRNLLNRYEAYIAAKQKQYLSTFPPHSLFCEKRCCQKSFRSYHRYLKQELQWSQEGHLR